MSAPALENGVRFRRAADGQGLLLIPEGIVNLNESAAAIVELIDGRRGVESIAADLATRYGVDVNAMTSDINDLLQRLAERGWLVLPARTKR